MAGQSTGRVTLDLRRSPLAGTAFGVVSAGVTMAEEPFRSLLEVRGATAPVVAADAARVWRLGPTWWLVDGAPADLPALEVPLAGVVRSATPGAAVVDVSAGRTTIVLSGPYAERVLAHGCPLDLSRVAVGDCVQGTLAGAQVAIGRTPDSLRVYVRPAFARHLAAWLTDAAREYA